MSETKKDSSNVVLNECLKRLPNQADFSPEALEKFARDLAVELGFSNGKVFHPIRVAISGRTQGPSLFHMMDVMGKDEVLKRIQLTVDKFFKV